MAWRSASAKISIMKRRNENGEEAGANWKYHAKSVSLSEAKAERLN